MSAEDEATSLTWTQSVYTALMRSSLAALRNLDLHYHVAQSPSDAQEERSGQPADPANSSVSKECRQSRLHECADCHAYPAQRKYAVTSPGKFILQFQRQGIRVGAHRVPAVAQSAGGAAGEALDVGPGLRARNPADMHAFLNLGAFLEAVLPAAGPALFEPWVRLTSLAMPSRRGRC